MPSGSTSRGGGPLRRIAPLNYTMFLRLFLVLCFKGFQACFSLAASLATLTGFFFCAHTLWDCITESFSGLIYVDSVSPEIVTPSHLVRSRARVVVGLQSCASVTNIHLPLTCPYLNDGCWVSICLLPEGQQYLACTQRQRPAIETTHLCNVCV